MKKFMLTAVAVILLAGCRASGEEPEPRLAHAEDDVSRYERQVVRHNFPFPAGVIVVDQRAKLLYFILDEQNGDPRAVRYGIRVGRDGMRWSGIATIGRITKDPWWYPPREMIRRQPRLKEYASGMPPGPDNPLGAYALRLHVDGEYTLYNIHGTDVPDTIGRRVSSGCFGMLNRDIRHLAARVRVGTKVVVLPAEHDDRNL